MFSIREEVTEDEEIYHILPVNDLEPHEESSMCKCEPEIQVQENGSVLVVHNSFDGREGLELAKEILDAKD